MVNDVRQKGVLKSVSVCICPFDSLPCRSEEWFENCDDVVALLFGEVLPCVCSRAVIGSEGIEVVVKRAWSTHGKFARSFGFG